METIISTKWDHYLECVPEIDIYYSESYVKLYERNDNLAVCIICRENENIMIFPILRKQYADYYDFETPYGYGGPLFNSGDEEWNHRALENMISYLKSQRYVCGFIRFHTLLENYRFCDNSFPVLFDRYTVCINTKDSIEAIWDEQISSKNRNMIRKAEKNGLVYQAEYDFASLEEFKHLYIETMRRLQADDFYFFDDDYFEQFCKNLKGNAFLGTVRKEGKLVCAALFMYSKKYGHYHLEGSDSSFPNMGANNFLLWKTVVEFHRIGVEKFHLGGGYNSDLDNSLLKFKKSFSRELKKFHIGKLVINPVVYESIKSEWKNNNGDKLEKYGKLLLCYRY